MVLIGAAILPHSSLILDPIECDFLSFQVTMLVDANSVEHFPLPAPQHHNEGQSPGEIHHLPEMGRSAAEGQSSDIMTYSQYVNGSIFSIPKSWSQKSTDDMLMTVYSFVKTFW